MRNFDMKTLKALPRDFALWLVWLCYTWFAVGFLAGHGASIYSGAVLLVSVILAVGIREVA